MKIKAQTAHEAKKQLLRIVFTSDYHHARYKHVPYGFVYVHFNAEACRFSFEVQQRKHSTSLIRRYEVVDMEDAIEIVATKYTLPQIFIGCINSRKIMTHREFFILTKEHFEWVGH